MSNGATTEPDGGASALVSARSVVIALDRRQQKALADYGEPPRGWIDALPYALQVLGRRRALRRDLRALQRRVAAAEARVLETLAALGERLVAEPEALEDEARAEALMERIREAGGELTTETEARDAVDEAADDERSALVRQLEAARERGRALRGHESRLRADLEAQRLDATRCRRRIESANKRRLEASDEATQARCLQERVDEERALDELQRTVAEGERELASVGLELAEARRAVADAEAPLAELDADLPRTLRRLEQVTREVSQGLALAHADLGRFGLEREGEALDESWPEVRAARVAVKAGGQLAKEIALHEAALADVDERGLVRGQKVLAGLGGVVALALVVAVLRSL